MSNTYVLRLWLPDRPGALGQVASRIGAVRGDVVDAEAVAQLVAADDVVDLYDGLVDQSRHVARATWSALVDVSPDGQEVLARRGDAPSGAWLRAFVAGSASARNAVGGDAIWAPLPSSALALVVGREGPPFRTGETRRLATLARVSGSRHRELVRARSRAEHPSSYR